MTARIPKVEACRHRFVARTLQWCPDCDLVRTVDDEAWTAGWASGWREHGFGLRQQLKAMGATSHVLGIVAKAEHEINAQVMPK